MAKKKQKVNPLSAKPLKETTSDNNSNGLVDSFIESKVTKVVTKKVTKKVTEIKKMHIGNKEITAEFTSTEKKRPNYNLSVETIDKIEQVSSQLGYKKAEFLDIYLNGTLSKILKDLNKQSKA